MYIISKDKNKKLCILLAFVILLLIPMQLSMTIQVYAEPLTLAAFVTAAKFAGYTCLTVGGAYAAYNTFIETAPPAAVTELMTLTGAELMYMSYTLWQAIHMAVLGQQFETVKISSDAVLASAIDLVATNDTSLIRSLRMYDTDRRRLHIRSRPFDDDGNPRVNIEWYGRNITDWNVPLISTTFDVYVTLGDYINETHLALIAYIPQALPMSNGKDFSIGAQAGQIEASVAVEQGLASEQSIGVYNPSIDQPLENPDDGKILIPYIPGLAGWLAGQSISEDNTTNMPSSYVDSDAQSTYNDLVDSQVGNPDVPYDPDKPVPPFPIPWDPSLPIDNPYPDTSVPDTSVPDTQQGLWQGIQGGIQTLVNQTTAILSWLYSFPNWLVESLINILSYLFVPSPDVITSNWNDLVEKAEEKYSIDLTGFKSLKDQTGSQFSDIELNHPLANSSSVVISSEYINNSLSFVHNVVRAFYYPMMIISMWKLLLYAIGKSYKSSGVEAGQLNNSGGRLS